jgi:hypothetical protein
MYGGELIVRRIVTAAASVAIGVAYAQGIPPPPTDGGLSGPGSVVADSIPQGLDPPPADPRDFEGVWLPGASDGGAPSGAGRGSPPGAEGAPGGRGSPPPGGSPGGASGTLFCAPVSRLQGAGGGMSDLWIMGPKMIVMISEEDMDVRKIYLNSEHPKDLTVQPNGHSVGRWDGNTLVVDSIGFSSADGRASDQHVVERIHKQQSGAAWHLVREFEITSNGQTRRHTSHEVWRPDLRVYENVCEENAFRFSVEGGQVKVSPLPAQRQ